VINGRFLLQNVTGVQRVGIEFLRALDELLGDGLYPDLYVEVLVPAREELVTELKLANIPLRPVGRLRGVAWEQVELSRHVRGATLLCLGNTAPAARLLRRKWPTYVMVHDLSYKYFPDAYSRGFRTLYQALMPVVLARSNHVFTVSKSEAASILEACPRFITAERLTVVQNGGGEATTHQPVGLEKRNRGALYVGSLTKRKNVDGLIAAAIELARHDDLDTVIVGGTGAIFDDEDRLLPADVTDRIQFLGQINDPDVLVELYRSASVFLFPSFYEASPLPPIEAMTHGLPVVSSDIPSLRERCGDAAVYCDPSLVSSIVGATRTLTQDDQYWAEAQGRGLVVAARYTWAVQVQAVLEVALPDLTGTSRE